MTRVGHGRNAMGLIVAVFVVLCLCYNVATPLFEGTDEAFHYRYMDYLAVHAAFPDLNSPHVQGVGATRLTRALERDSDFLGQEVTQPPLYYVAGAGLIFWMDRSDFPQVHRTIASTGHGLTHEHTPAELAVPPSGTVLAVRVVRLLSTALGALTVALAYASAHLLFRRAATAVIAAAITAFNPKFLHLSSTITNDIAVAALVALALYAGLRIVLATAFSLRHFAAGAAVMGVCVGLASLVKYSALAAAAPAGVVLLWVALKHRGTHPAMRTLVTGVLACVAGFTAAAGWYFLYNTVRYHHPLAWAQVQAANAFTARGTPLTGLELLSSLPALLRSYWGVFGDGIQAPPLYDTPYWAFLAIATAGLLVALVRRTLPAAIVVLVASVLATLAAFVSWTRGYAVTDNSRLLSPITLSVSVLAAAGVMAWLPARWSQVARAAAAGGAAALGAGWAILVLFVALVTGYAPPDYLTPEEASALPRDGRARFDNGLILASASLQSSRVDTDGQVDLTTYWQVTRPITAPHALVLQAFDEGNHLLGRISTGAFLGRPFVIQEWQAGRSLRIALRLPISTSRQTLARIYIGMYEELPPNRLVTLIGQEGVSVQVAQVKVRGSRLPERLPAQRAQARFGDVIRLEGYEACGNRLSLFWRSTGVPDLDYTVFVHGLDARGDVIGQSDAPMHLPTSFWDAGEQVIDVHGIARLGEVRALRVGMYDPRTGERLPAYNSTGAPWADQAVPVESFERGHCE